MPDFGNVTWDQDDASNNSPPPDGVPEGQNPSTVNNCIRMIMDAVKHWWVWSIPKFTADTSTAYTVSYTEAFAWFVWRHGSVGRPQISWVSRDPRPPQSIRWPHDLAGAPEQVPERKACGGTQGPLPPAARPEPQASFPLSATNAIRFPVRA